MPSEERTRLDRLPGAQELQLVVAAGGRLWTHPVPQRGRVEIGRQAQLAIDHPHVSRVHAALLAVGPVVVIEDLGSANGTWVRERRLESGERVRIEAGDLVRLGRSVCFWLQEVGGSDEMRLLRELSSSAGEPVVVESPAMQALFATLDRVAVGDVNVLILGETGVGKALVARALHERSRRAGGPFSSLDCAGLSESLLESELFGHEKGAFTGAVSSKPGLLEGAQGGTIFLDEVGELPVGCQAKLLRPLEDRVVQRLGSVKTMPIDVRFVAATNRDLEAEVGKGRFRKDLFFRLDGFTLEVPPLRARREEILPLARAYAQHFAARLGRPVPALAPEAEQLLVRHDWPGNVRELRQALERAVLLCGQGVIEPQHLRLDRRIQAGEPVAPEVGDPQVSGDTTIIPADGDGPDDEPDEGGPVEPEELLRIKRALEECGGNQSRAAKLLGISRKTLIRRLDRYGLPRPRGKEQDSAP